MITECHWYSEARTMCPHLDPEEPPWQPAQKPNAICNLHMHEPCRIKNKHITDNIYLPAFVPRCRGRRSRQDVFIRPGVLGLSSVCCLCSVAEENPMWWLCR